MKTDQEARMALADRLKRAIVTAQNDDLSEPLSEKRERHVERVEAMRDAEEFIRSAAQAGGEPVAWRTPISTGNQLTSHADVAEQWCASGLTVECLYAAPIAGEPGAMREAEIVRLINELRADEGDSVTILGDNPDFNGQPNCAIECCGDWTGWLHKRFAADTLLDTLSMAATERKLPSPRDVIAESNGHHWVKRFNYVCCRDCGFLRRPDDKNAPCKGPVGVGPRAALAHPQPAAGEREEITEHKATIEKFFDDAENADLADEVYDQLNALPARKALNAILSLMPARETGRPKAFLAWAVEMFGSVAKLRSERLMRFIEEAIELAHADGMERYTLDAIANRVYSRPQGSVTKEIGQAQACLETYAENIGESSDLLAELEWQRVQRIPRSEWERRHAAKQAIGIAEPSPPTAQREGGK